MLNFVEASEFGRGSTDFVGNILTNRLLEDQHVNPMPIALRNEIRIFKIRDKCIWFFIVYIVATLEFKSRNPL